MTNKELIEKYPWLTPSNRWSGKWITDCAGPDGEEGYWPGNPEEHPDYNYDYTELDNMPEGWRRAFGEEMCEEINTELMTWPQENREKFRILDIKEKWAELRFYTNFSTPRLHEIIGKYTTRSRFICILCGRPARWITRGWYMPFCQNCAEEQMQHINSSYSAQTDWDAEFIDIDKYYKKEE